MQVNLSIVVFYIFQVQALKFGHVLLIDEADKAPINVTCVLKTLVESGEMILGDGRRVLPGKVKYKNLWRHFHDVKYMLANHMQLYQLLDYRLQVEWCAQLYRTVADWSVWFMWE